MYERRSELTGYNLRHLPCDSRAGAVASAAAQSALSMRFRVAPRMPTVVAEQSITWSLAFLPQRWPLRMR